MATLNRLRKLLHRKSAEICTPLAAGNTAAGGFLVSDKGNLVPGHDSMYYVGGASAIWNYNADEDAWMQLPNSGITGAFGAGSTGEYRALSAPGGVFIQSAAASGHTTKRLSTSLALRHNCKGYILDVVEGSGAGFRGEIDYVTTGANSVIYLKDAAPVAFSSTTKFRIFGGSLWFFNAGTSAVGFSVYDRITGAWTARSVAGLPTAWGTDGQLIATPGAMANLITARVLSASGTLIDLVGSDYVAGANYKTGNCFQMRVVSGTGAGQIRTCTGTVDSAVGVTVAFSPQLDNTSVVVVEGNDDFFYLLGNNAVTMYRFSVSGNAWTTLAPTAARAGAIGAGGTANWIESVPDPQWIDQGGVAHYTSTMFKQNGRYIFSFRGAGSSALDAYDLPMNTWISNIPYAGQMETLTTGSCGVDVAGMIYLMKESSGRFLRYDVAQNTIEPYVFNPIPQGTVVVGDKVTIQTYDDGGDTIRFLYSLSHTRTELVRWLMV